MNGHLDLKTLKEQESLLFGGTDGESGRRSRVIVRCEQKKFDLPEKKYKMIAHKGGETTCFEVEQEICIILGLTKDIDLGSSKVFNLEMLKALFEVFCYLGGLGKRNRRGNGGLKITKYKTKIDDNEIEHIYEQLDFETTLVRKLNLVCLDKKTDSLQIFRTNDTNTLITANFSVTDKHIPHIVSIEKINQQGTNESLRKKISQATHNTKDTERLEIVKTEKQDGKNEGEYRYRLNYGKFVGNGKPRFASPLIFSILPSQQIVVTKLKTIKENNQNAEIIDNNKLKIQDKLITEVKNIAL